MQIEMNPKYPLFSLLMLARPYLGRVAQALLAMVCAAAAFLLLPYALGNVFDYGFSKEVLMARHESFVWFIAIALLTAVLSAWRFYVVSWLGEKVVADLRKMLFARVLRFDVAQFEALKTGEILSRLSTDTSLIQQVVGSSVSILLRNSIQSAGALVMLFVTSWYLAGLFVLLVPLLLGPFWVVMRAQRALSRQNQDKIAQMGAFAGEVLYAIMVTKAFGHEAYDQVRYNNACEDVYASALKRVRRRSLLVIIIMLALTLALMTIFWVGSGLLMNQSITSGQLAQFFLYAAILVTGVLSISEVWGEIVRASAASERLVELCCTRPSIDDGLGATSLALENAKTKVGVAFSKVCFAYPSRPDAGVLNGMDFVVNPGQTVALVGASGAGKSTVLQLLMRFYEPSSGCIKIAGRKLNTITLASLREVMSVVPQEVVVFSGSILDNIQYGDPSASYERVIAAAKHALVDDFVQRLPEGYETLVGERGMRLSGGQRQRLAIARAFLRDAPILLLDEATSSLDAENERLVQKAIDQLMQSRTTLVIAHRLATVQKADCILVIEDGRVSASGKHAELLKSSPQYAHLAKLQLMQEEA